MRNADTKAQALFDACFKILSPPAAPRLIIQELENQLVLMIDNPSSSNNFEEGYEEMLGERLDDADGDYSDPLPVIF